MKHPCIKRFFLLAFLLPGFLFASIPEDQLDRDEVLLTMNQMLHFHIDKNEMSQELLRRSMDQYFEAFDRIKIYLLDNEVSQFVTRDKAYQGPTLAQYYTKDFSSYAEADRVIRNAIMRAKAWRQGLVQKLSTYFENGVEIAKFEDYENYAQNLKELHGRMEKEFIYFVAQQAELLGGFEKLVGREEELIRFYERKLYEHERHFLEENIDSLPLTPKQIEHERNERIMKALAKSLDAHSSFFSAAEAYDMKARLEKGFSGIGIVLQESLDGVIITRLLEGGPAQETGKIIPNDRIVMINGLDITEWSFEKVLDGIRGEDGEAIILGLQSAKEENGNFDSETRQVEVVRRHIEVNDKRVDVTYSEIEGGIIGKITLYSFYDGDNGVSSEKDVREAIRSLKRVSELKGLVLDLRENSGGFLMQAVKVAGLFITNGVVVISKYSDGEVRYFRDIDGYSYYDGPMVVLTSKASASAAEIVAQALQDYGAALVVGDDRTYGKGSVQHQTVTDESSAAFFKVTVGGYYTVSGASTQVKGVKADIVVPTRYYYEELGEENVAYPLHFDDINPAFEDRLWDVDPSARYWYAKYYLPTLEDRQVFWKEAVPLLKERSAERLKKNEDFKKYLEGLKQPNGEKLHLASDLQLDEAVEIVKDMILFQQEHPVAQKNSQ